jgi:metal-responsive CopG/Arc/MetJ family transcriptional regulator
MKRTYKPRQTQTAIRLPNDLLERLDRIAERWTNDGPGMTATRSDVVRALLLRAVEQEEKRHGR